MSVFLQTGFNIQDDYGMTIFSMFYIFLWHVFLCCGSSEFILICEVRTVCSVVVMCILMVVARCCC
jgi:hypothetical protein